MLKHFDVFVEYFMKGPSQRNRGIVIQLAKGEIVHEIYSIIY